MSKAKPKATLNPVGRYLTRLEESILSNIVFEVTLLRGMTRSTLRWTATLTIITLMLFNPYTLGASAVVGAMAAVSAYIFYTVYGMGKKQSGYPHFEATHMIGLLFAFPLMLAIAWICGMAGYYGVEFIGVSLFG
jgi:hypothetical protein